MTGNEKRDADDEVHSWTWICLLELNLFGLHFFRFLLKVRNQTWVGGSLRRLGSDPRSVCGSKQTFRTVQHQHEDFSEKLFSTFFTETPWRHLVEDVLPSLWTNFAVNLKSLGLLETVQTRSLSEPCRLHKVLFSTSVLKTTMKAFWLLWELPASVLSSNCPRRKLFREVVQVLILHVSFSCTFIHLSRKISNFLNSLKCFCFYFPVNQKIWDVVPTVLFWIKAVDIQTFVLRNLQMDKTRSSC